nr:tRNA lysidine(34) synthetase TilS [Rubellimicrobium aerolatum]
MGVAVSGGGDSLALLLLTVDWARERGVALRAATVDHGLRAGSAAEAEGVARLCAGLGLGHDVLRWAGWDGRGNLQDRARTARRGLLSAWAEGAGVGHVLLGHTRDDQAETLLLRLGRGSGVDGLAGMRGWSGGDPVWWGRPLLGVTREALREWLRGRGAAWVEDPSNADPRFGRARARAMGEALAGLGLTRERLARTAGHMARAQASLRAMAAGVAAREAREEGADLLLPLGLLARIGEEDTAGRLLADGLAWVGGRSYRPRHEALVRIAGGLVAGRPATLGGCRLRPEGAWLRIAREARALAEPVEAVGPATRWDGRWILRGPGRAGLWVGALGEAGLGACPGWEATGLPRGALLASPAVRDGGRLVAAPLAGRGQGWTAAREPAFAGFIAR